ncbi:MAG: hypothetical protein QNJ47_09575 [Nostocaceae cyanobacterium]|nr:hypothetical protein [Nostocaceae cyanobacterium]
MAFIKIQNVVINTNYVAAVRLDCQTISGEKSVSILIANPNVPSLEWETISPNLYQNQWMEFTGEAALALQDYFSSGNNVIDLLPHESSII